MTILDEGKTREQLEREQRGREWEAAREAMEAHLHLFPNNSGRVNVTIQGEPGRPPRRYSFQVQTFTVKGDLLTIQRQHASPGQFTFH